LPGVGVVQHALGDLAAVGDLHPVQVAGEDVVPGGAAVVVGVHPGGTELVPLVVAAGARLLDGDLRQQPLRLLGVGGGAGAGGALAALRVLADEHPQRPGQAVVDHQHDEGHDREGRDDGDVGAGPAAVAGAARGGGAPGRTGHGSASTCPFVVFKRFGIVFGKT